MLALRMACGLGGRAGVQRCAAAALLAEAAS